MRIEQIDVDGFGGLTGSFHFPQRGLGLWCAPNEGGKTLLVAAIECLLYGPSDVAGVIPASGWIMIRFTQDDGTPLVVARDLTARSLQVTDASGEDVTAAFDDSASLGERLLRLTRAEFRSLVGTNAGDLPATISHPVLLSLLRHGRGQSAPSSASPAAEITTDTAPAVDSAGASFETDDDDLQIFRSAAEELGYGGGGSPDLDATVVTTPSSAPTAPEVRRPSEVRLPELGDGPRLQEAMAAPDAVARLRQMRAGLQTLDERFDLTQDSFREFSAQVDDLQAEAERLEALTGAVPQDVEKLNSLLDGMSRVQERREQLRIDESRFRRDLEEGGAHPDLLLTLEDKFAGLEGGDREFLEEYHQAETIRRGNQALVRSESRLDDTRISEIDRARQDAQKMAVAPLVVSALGLFGSLALNFGPKLPVPPSIFLALGMIGAAAGSYLLWRAKHLRSAERRELQDTLHRKRSQMDEFEKEESYATGRLGMLAEKCRVEPANQLVETYSEWKEKRTEIRSLLAFASRAHEIERDLISIREKLGSFVSVDQEVSAAELQALLEDYRRFFLVDKELRIADERSAEFEAALADLETERARFRERIGEILEERGVDATRDLDEAIEIFARREGTSTADADPALPAATAESTEAGPNVIDLTEGSTAPAAGGSDGWIAPVSARAEQIARALIPEVHELELSADLEPTVRFSESGPRLRWDELAPRLSGAAIDQLCLALRVAIVETVSSTGESLPLVLDDPLVRSDDARHARGLQFLFEDAAEQNQTVLLTAHEVRTRWFLHQNPRLKDHVTTLAPAPAAPTPAAATPAPATPATPASSGSHSPASSASSSAPQA